MSIFYNVCLSDYSPAAYPDYYPEYSSAVPSEDQRLAMLYNLLEDREQQQEAGEAVESSTPAPPTPGTTPPTPRPGLIMTKERRGMAEEPILRPDSARDPQYLYRGRKKRSAEPVPPFVQTTGRKIHL